jgi:hypothetical protein
MRLVKVAALFVTVSWVEGYVTEGPWSQPPISELKAATTVPSRRGWYRRRSNNDSPTIIDKRRRRKQEPPSIDLQGFSTQPLSVRGKQSLFQTLTCQGVASFVSRLISRGATKGEAHVQVRLHHGLRKLLSSGVLHADASLVVPHHLHFNALRFSSGVVEASDIQLHVATQQYLESFTLTAKDVQLTANDLMESPCIRHGLRRLLTRVLISDFAVCRIDDIRIHERTMVLLGTVTTILGQRVPFQVASGLAAANGMLLLKELNVNVNGIPVRKFPLLSLHMGPNTFLESVVLKEDTMHVSAKVIITPDLQVVPQTVSQDATWTFDVGRWLTQKGRFHNDSSG